MGVLCVEMESAGLYTVAALCGKRALALLSISDHLVTGEALPAEERQTSFTNMMRIALDTAVAMAQENWGVRPGAGGRHHRGKNYTFCARGPFPGPRVLPLCLCRRKGRMAFLRRFCIANPPAGICARRGNMETPAGAGYFVCRFWIPKADSWPVCCRERPSPKRRCRYRHVHNNRKM